MCCYIKILGGDFMVRQFEAKRNRVSEEDILQNSHDSVDDYDTVDDDDERQDFMRGYEEGMFGEEDAEEFSDDPLYG